MDEHISFKQDDTESELMKEDDDNEPSIVLQAVEVDFSEEQHDAE